MQMVTSTHAATVRSLPPGAVLLAKSHRSESSSRSPPPQIAFADCLRGRQRFQKALSRGNRSCGNWNPTVAPAAKALYSLHVPPPIVVHVPPAVVIHVAPVPLLKAPRIMPPGEELTAKQKVKNLLDLTRVVIIRHGEKTNDEDTHLNAAGYTRAAALPDFLLGVNTPWKKLDRDNTVIYAMKERDADGSSGKGPGSRRPLETVLPLAKRLGLALNEGGVNDDETFYNNIRKDKTEKLVDSILDGSHRGKTVLICWEHTAEIDIANRLGVPVTGWGLDPLTKNNGKNFTAIWLLTPDGDKLNFEVFQEFRVDPVTFAVTYPDPSQKPRVNEVYDKDQLKDTMKRAGKKTAYVAVPVAA